MKDKLYKCVNPWTMNMMDGDECTIEDEYGTVEAGSVWRLDEEAISSAYDGVRLYSADDKSDFYFIDVPKACLGTDLVLID